MAQEPTPHTLPPDGGALERAARNARAADLARRPRETAGRFLERMELRLGLGYIRWIQTDDGQAALSAAQAEDRAARRGSDR